MYRYAVLSLPPVHRERSLRGEHELSLRLDTGRLQQRQPRVHQPKLRGHFARLQRHSCKLRERRDVCMSIGLRISRWVLDGERAHGHVRRHQLTAFKLTRGRGGGEERTGTASSGFEDRTAAANEEIASNRKRSITNCLSLRRACPTGSCRTIARRCCRLCLLRAT